MKTLIEQVRSQPESAMPRRNIVAMTTCQRKVDKRLSNARRRRRDRLTEDA
jgi:hypothetical protein